MTEWVLTLVKLLFMQMQRRENDMQSFEKLQKVIIIFQVLILGWQLINNHAKLWSFIMLIKDNQTSQNIYHIRKK